MVKGKLEVSVQVICKWCHLHTRDCYFDAMGTQTQTGRAMQQNLAMVLS